MIRNVIIGHAFLVAACAGRSPQEQRVLSEPQWEECDTGDCSALLLGIDFADAKIGVAVGGTTETGPAVILRTEDGGATWSPVEVEANGRLYAIDFVTGTLGYTVGYDVMLRTRDGGASWNRVTLPESGWLASVSFATEQLGFAVGGPAQEPVAWVTTDGGESWSSALGRLPAGMRSSLRHVSFISEERGFILGYDGLLLETTDCGETWRAKDSGSSAWLRSISFSGDSGYIASSTGLLTSHDRGASWHPVTTLEPCKLNDVLFIARGLGWVTTFEGELLETVDSGQRWKTALHHEGTLTWFSLREGCRVFVAADRGRIYQRATPYIMAESVDYEDPSHLGRTLKICGWTKSEVVEHFGTDFVEHTEAFWASPFGRYEVPSGTDEQLVYGAGLSRLYVYLREGRVLHAFEAWSDW